MSSQMVYLVIDCYPNTNSAAFREFTGATVGCWVRADICRAGVTAESLARERISAVGWSAVRTLFSEEVSSATYVSKSEGREYFEQAEIDGFVTNFHVRRRELIGEKGNASDDAANAMPGVVAALARSGGVSLFVDRDRQWANGVTPNGDEFLPLWLTAEDALGWLEHWPGYEIRHLSVEELGSGFLERIDATGMWVGLAIEKSLLITCHSAWVKHLLAGEPAEGIPGDPTHDEPGK